MTSGVTSKVPRVGGGNLPSRFIESVVCRMYGGKKSCRVAGSNPRSARCSLLEHHSKAQFASLSYQAYGCSSVRNKVKAVLRW